MSTVEYNFETNGVNVPQPINSAKKSSSNYHRLSEVRRQQGVSIRSAARRLNLTAQETRDQEDPSTDLQISQLLCWQKILDVPLADLLVDFDGPLSEPVNHRASMLRIMKTAKAISEAAKDGSVRRLAEMLVSQLVAIMPELADVSAWHSVGQRRTQEELGRIVEKPIPENFFHDASR